MWCGSATLLRHPPKSSALATLSPSQNPLEPVTGQAHYARVKADDPKDVIEPEVIPPGSNGDGPSAGEPVASVRITRLKRAVVSGLILDMVDLYSFMPSPPVILAGAAAGALVGWYLCRTQEVPPAQRVWWISLAAIYCAMPKTHFYPLATLILMYRALARR